MRKLAALLLLALATGCSGGGQGAEPQVRQSLSAADAEVKFAQCMRDNGISDYPDTIGSEGYTVKDPDAFDKAQETCAKWREAGGLTKKVDAAYVDAVTRFAKCMRERGMNVHDPDPRTGQYSVSVDNKDRAAFEKAQNECVHLLPR
ncbi:hypothetical protein [Nonomuraea sp. C10]|uniref:hypothetical protein n=1 Tax=Nonomuraea sp. C10 TaxID=2600577 RepID=UPI0011CD5037|nr:hypothetical protein [Nonomuraea sp. C10]TXK34853.1 hypothetical protein FR742_36725 [Nonomuraea sp. C10]